MSQKLQREFSAKLPREMRFQVKGLFSSYEINVKFPKTFKKIISLGGDWGPNFKLQVDPYSLFEIQIKSKSGDKTIFLQNEIKEIFLKTPFLLSDRKDCLYQCEIPISCDGLILHLYFDEELKIKKAQMIKHWKSESSNLRTEILEFAS